MTGTAPLIFDSLKLRPAIILIGVATLPMLPACTGNRKPTAENLVAETAEAKADLAKKALLDLARTDPQAFMDLDLDRIEKVPIERETTETFQWGAFVIDVRRLTFSADVPSREKLRRRFSGEPLSSMCGG